MTAPIDARTVEQVRQAVRDLESVRVVGGGSKTALSRDANLNVSGLRGVIEYDPSEYTITALAATPVREINRVLAEHRQFLPFDPPLVEAGATLGGTIAAGLSGSGRFRYGGTRDFLLGLRLINGEGDAVRGGGRVVKNAAGFDIPKLMVGSLGRLGVLVEATFKVFPRPESYVTLLARHGGVPAALEDLQRVALSPAEASCLDLVDSHTVAVRLGGMAAARNARIESTRKLLQGQVEVVDDDTEYWREAGEFRWLPADHSLVKIPITPSLIPALEQSWNELGAGPRRYSVGGHVLWLSWPQGQPWTKLDQVLKAEGRTAVVVLGTCDEPLRGARAGGVFAERLAQIFDPRHAFRPRATAPA